MIFSGHFSIVYILQAFIDLLLKRTHMAARVLDVYTRIIQSYGLSEETVWRSSCTVRIAILILSW